MQPGRILLITGTDTGVGKTVLSALLVRFLLQEKVLIGALKPIASGGRSDARILHAAQQGRFPLAVVNPWHYRAPLAPVLAARREQRPLRLRQVTDHIRACRRHVDVLIVESAGGLLSPLGEDFDSRDLLTALRATPLIVSQNRLGAVNQVRQTLAALPPAARRRAIVVLNTPRIADPATPNNAGLLGEWEPGNLIVTLPWHAQWNTPTARLPLAVTRSLRVLVRAAGLMGGGT